MKSQIDASYFDTIVIGAGQAGLSVGYNLAKRGIPFTILDAHARVGDAWRNRWDSLRLFTPARSSGADIGIEVARSHLTFLSGKESGHVPWPIETTLGKIMFRGMRFLGHHVLTQSTPVGRKLRPKLLASAAPLIRVKPQELIDAG